MPLASLISTVLVMSGPSYYFCGSCLQVDALQAQMEEQTRLAKEQVESLLEDRQIQTEEALAQRQRDQERFTAMTDKWVCVFSCSPRLNYLLVCFWNDAPSTPFPSRCITRTSSHI